MVKVVEPRCCAVRIEITAKLVDAGKELLAVIEAVEIDPAVELQITDLEARLVRVAARREGIVSGAEIRRISASRCARHTDIRWQSRPIRATHFRSDRTA